MLEDDDTCIVHPTTPRDRCAPKRRGIATWCFERCEPPRPRPFAHLSDEELHTRAVAILDELFTLAETSEGIVAPPVPYLRHRGRLRAATVEARRARHAVHVAEGELVKALAVVRDARDQVDDALAGFHRWLDVIELLAVEVARTRQDFEAAMPTSPRIDDPEETP